MMCIYIDERVIGSGMGLFLGAIDRRFCHKTQKGPAKCVYCVRVLFSPPVAEIRARLAGQKLSVVDNIKVWGI
jgi:hypothetical protein